MDNKHPTKPGRYTGPSASDYFTELSERQALEKQAKEDGRLSPQHVETSGDANRAGFYDPLGVLRLLQENTIEHARKLHNIMSSMPSRKIEDTLHHHLIDMQLQEILLIMRGR